MPIMSREEIIAIAPGNYGPYESLIRSLQETAIQNSELPDPPVPEPSTHDPNRMRVYVVQYADGYVECYAGNWIKAEIVQPDEGNCFRDEDLPTYMRLRANGFPKFTSPPNLTTKGHAAAAIRGRKLELTRVEQVIDTIKSRPNAKELEDYGEYNGEEWGVVGLDPVDPSPSGEVEAD